MVFYTRSFLCTLRYNKSLKLMRMCDFCRYICLSATSNSHQNESAKIAPDHISAGNQRKLKKLHNRPKSVQTESNSFKVDLALEDTFGLLSQKSWSKKILSDNDDKTQSVPLQDRLSLSDEVPAFQRKQRVGVPSAQTSSPKVHATLRSSKGHTKRTVTDKTSADVFGTLTEDVVIEEDITDSSDEDEHRRHRPLTGTTYIANWYGRQIEKLGRKWKVKEAIDVLEEDMLVRQRVMPNSYVFTCLIGVVGRAGYTKKAFQLFNKMKKMGLTPDETTYTSLFNACANSPWSGDGLSRAHKLYGLMREKGVQPNLINYKAMVKAFGVCGDLRMAFRVMDELCENYRPDAESFSFLLMACISDRNAGFRHAMQVWRLMKQYRVRPDLSLYNLLLRVVRDCAFNKQQALGTSEKRPLLKQQPPVSVPRTNQHIADYDQNGAISEIKHSEDLKTLDVVCGDLKKPTAFVSGNLQTSDVVDENLKTTDIVNENCKTSDIDSGDRNTRSDNVNENFITSQDVTTSDFHDSSIDSWWQETGEKDNTASKRRSLATITQDLDVGWSDPPDSSSLSSSLDSAESRLALFGGARGWLRGMDEERVQPDVKTFMQLFDFSSPLETEEDLLSLMDEHGVKPDTDLLNNLIHKRCMRQDFKAAREVLQLLGKYGLQANMQTYGCLAMTCKKRSEGHQLLKDMENAGLDPNIEILGTLVYASYLDFHYKLDIVKHCEKLNLKPNTKFLQHTERSIASAKTALVQLEKGNVENKFLKSDYFQSGFKDFMFYYRPWLQQTKLDTPGHPWKPFRHEKNKE